ISVGKAACVSDEVARIREVFVTGDDGPVCLVEVVPPVAGYAESGPADLDLTKVPSQPGRDRPGRVRDRSAQRQVECRELRANLHSEAAPSRSVRTEEHIAPARARPLRRRVNSLEVGT